MWTMTRGLFQPQLFSLSLKIYWFIENSITYLLLIANYLFSFTCYVPFCWEASRFLLRTPFVTVEVLFTTRIPERWYVSYSRKWSGLVEKQAVLLLRLYLLLQPLSMLIQKMFVNWSEEHSVISYLAATALKHSIRTHLALLTEIWLLEPLSSFTPLSGEYVGSAQVPQHGRMDLPVGGAHELFLGKFSSQPNWDISIASNMLNVSQAAEDHGDKLKTAAPFNWVLIFEPLESLCVSSRKCVSPI